MMQGCMVQPGWLWNRFIIYSYFVLVDGRRFVSVPLNYSIPGHDSATPQCYLVQERCLKITYIGYAGKSKVSSMKTARSRLDLHAMVHKALNVPTEHFKTGLKHQRLRTAFSWKHIWNLPAIYTLVIYKIFSTWTLN